MFMLADGTILIGHTSVYRLQSICEGFIYHFISKVTKCLNENCYITAVWSHMKL